MTRYYYWKVMMMSEMFNQEDWRPDSLKQRDKAVARKERLEKSLVENRELLHGADKEIAASEALFKLNQDFARKRHQRDRQLARARNSRDNQESKMVSEDFETQGTENEFLQEYEQRKDEYPAFALTADIVLLTIKQGKLCVLLIERQNHPEKGKWALPGGFVGIDESAENAAIRELSEETGVTLSRAHIEQLKTYSSPRRDPRMRVISTAFIALVPNADLPELEAGDDAAQAHFFPVYDIIGDNDDMTVDLAFDHDVILSDGIDRISNKLEYTNLAATFLEEPFTLADLRRVYEEVWNTELHAANFRRKILSVKNFVEEVGGKGTSRFSGGNTASLYRQGKAEMLMPPMLRSE